VRLDVAYDGTAFHGWQRQPERRTVQGVLEEKLRHALGEPVSLTGAGRTDAGCHARGQVASFTTDAALPVAALVPVMNRILPADVRVRAAAEAPAGFHARRSARGRRYAYRLLREDDVLQSRFAWHPPRGFDADGLARATRAVEGEHDFSLFHASGSSPVDSRCRVLRASWRSWELGVQLDIVADHFLYHMVRGIVGTALMLQRDADPGAAMRERVLARERSAAGPTAPARGLCLEQVFYDAERP
jgi:tRNA pseudouridine38-40 synthase